MKKIGYVRYQPSVQFWIHFMAVSGFPRRSLRFRTCLQADGRVVEEGSHDDLLLADGHYRRLLEHQLPGLWLSSRSLRPEICFASADIWLQHVCFTVLVCFINCICVYVSSLCLIKVWSLFWTPHLGVAYKDLPSTNCCVSFQPTIWYEGYGLGCECMCSLSPC